MATTNYNRKAKAMTTTNNTCEWCGEENANHKWDEETCSYIVCAKCHKKATELSEELYDTVDAYMWEGFRGEVLDAMVEQEDCYRSALEFLGIDGANEVIESAIGACTAR